MEVESDKNSGENVMRHHHLAMKYLSHREFSGFKVIQIIVIRGEISEAICV